MLVEELAVDEGEVREFFGERWALVFGCVEDLEDLVEECAQAKAVGSGFVDDGLEPVGVEDAGVVGEEHEEDADEEAFEGVAGIGVGFEGIVELAEDFDGLDVDGVLGVDGPRDLAGEEGEVLGVFVEFFGEEVGGGGRGVVAVEIEDDDAVEVGEDDVLGDFGSASVSGEVLDIGEGLGLGFGEVLPLDLCSPSMTPA